jgi:hypothetical protein
MITNYKPGLDLKPTILLKQTKVIGNKWLNKLDNKYFNYKAHILLNYKSN